ncbi:MAG: tetratricopeptide repeat protein [bacterium]
MERLRRTFFVNVRTAVIFTAFMLAGFAAAGEVDFGAALAKGVALLDDSRYEESLKVFSGLLERAPDDGMLHYYIGRNYQYMRRFDKAIEHLRRATELNPRHANSFCYLGYAMASKGDELKNSGVINKAKGLKLQMEAKGPLTKALELEPRNACANTGLARADIFFRNWDEARKKCETALETEPGRTTAMIYLGWALFGLGREEEGAKWLEKAGVMIPELDAWAHFTIGDIYADFGRWKEALPYIEKALEIDPDYEGGRGKKRLEQARRKAG